MKNKGNFNEWYLFNDGFFSYYINNATGEKKFELEDGDVEVEANLDDFCSFK